MAEREFLPLGSIVTIEEVDKKLMIVQRGRWPWLEMTMNGTSTMVLVHFRRALTAVISFISTMMTLSK